MARKEHSDIAVVGILLLRRESSVWVTATIAMRVANVNCIFAAAIALVLHNTCIQMRVLALQ
jgi:hypothetical protein